MIYIFLFLIMLVIDQYTKYIIDTNFFVTESVSIIDKFLNLTYVQNRGIAFGLFQGKLDIVTIFAVLAILAIFVNLLRNFKKIDILEKLAYTMILSGAVGNIIDRIMRGFVVDMIDFRGLWSFIFNFADVWINIGILLLIVEYIFFNKKRRK